MASIKVGTVYIDVEPDVSKFSERLRRGLASEQSKIGSSAAEIGNTISSKLGFGQSEADAKNLGNAISASLEKAGQSAVAFGKDSDRTSVSIDKFGDKTALFNNRMRAFQNILSLLKIPAAFAGLGVAASGLTAVAAGGLAAVSALGPLAGLLVAMPAPMFGIAAAAGTISLAFNDMGAALKGTKGAMEKLTETQKDFVKTLQSLKPIKKELQEIAANNLLPGITAGMKAAFSPDNISAIKVIIKDTAQSLSGLASNLGKEFAKPEWAEALLTISETNKIGFDKVGNSLIGAAAGFRDLFLAAQPLVRWLIDITAKGLELAGVWAKNAAESGNAAKFFNETKEILSILGGLFGNLIRGLIDIGKAAYPLGKTILKSVADQLGRMADWAKSEGGKQTLKSYFDAALPILSSVSKLILGLAGALLQVGKAASDAGLSQFFDRIRTEVLPLFKSGLLVAVKDLAPRLLDLGISLGKIAGTLLGSSAPLKIFVDALSKAADFIADLLSNNPALSEFVVLFSAIVAITKIFNVSGMIRGIYGTVVAYRAQQAAATGATGAQTGLNAAMRANPIGLIVTALQVLVAGLFLAWSQSETFRDVVKASLEVVKDVAKVVVDFILAQWRSLNPMFAIFITVIKSVITIFNSLKDAVSVAIGIVKTVVSGFVQYFESTWLVAIMLILNTVKTMFLWFQNSSGAVWEAVRLSISTMVNIAKAAFQELETAVDRVKVLFVWFRDVGSVLWATVRALVVAAVDLIKDAFAQLYTPVNKVQDIFIWMREHGGDAISAMWKAAQKPLELIAEGFDKIKDVMDSIMDALKWLRDNVGDILGKVGDIVGKVGGALGKIGIGGTGPFDAGSIIPPGNIGPTMTGTFSSLSSNLQDEAGMAANSFAYQIQTYNPASRLPGGGPSDHAVYPSKAFDAMFSPASGWAHDGARAFFMSLIGRAGIHYAILGDKIWSAERGLHSYGYGGHENHVHVSGYAKGGFVSPGQWGMVGEEGPELIRAGKAGATVVPINDRALINVEEMHVRNDTDVNLIAAALHRKALALG